MNSFLWSDLKREFMEQELLDGNLISVVLPTCGRSGKFACALESVFNQLNKNWELVVVNDGEIAVEKYFPEEKKILYMQNSSQIGAAASRNKGILASKGSYIAYLDDDDEWLPDHLSVPFEILHEYDFIYSGTRVRNGSSTIPWYNKTFSYKRLAKTNFITTPSVIHKKSLLLRSGLWNERLECLQDWDLWCRMLLRTDKIFFREKQTVIINRSRNSITSRSVSGKTRKRNTLHIQLRYYFPLIIKHMIKGRR
jgi:glycosyltransferase involved in cell wall biosynthesis